MNDINNEFAADSLFAEAMFPVSPGRYAALVALALGLTLGCGGDMATSSSGAPGATNIGDTGGITGGAGGSSAAEAGGTAGSGGDTAGSLPTSAGETTGADGATTDASESSGDAGHWVPPPPVTLPPLPPPPDYSGYPVDDMGRPIVAMGSLVNWVVVSTPDPMTAREGCAALVANCHDPELRSIDACMMSAPHCATAEPWTEPSPCCADACFAAYATQRLQGTDPLTAYLRILYDGPICMPGVDAMLGGAP